MLNRVRDVLPSEDEDAKALLQEGLLSADEYAQEEENDYLIRVELTAATLASDLQQLDEWIVAEQLKDEELTQHRCEARGCAVVSRVRVACLRATQRHCHLPQGSAHLGVPC